MFRCFCFWLAFTQCSLLHIHCKRSAYCQLGLSFSQNYRRFADRQSFRASAAGAKKKTCSIHLVKQMEALLQAYCFETIARCRQPDERTARVKAFARDLVQCLALHLAEVVSEVLQGVLRDTAHGLVDTSNAESLSPKFWIQAIYTELLHASCRYEAIREKEACRAATALVKVTCLPYDGLAVQRHRDKRRVKHSQVNLLGDRCWTSNLLVWFPAAWFPLVAEAIQYKKQ